MAVTRTPSSAWIDEGLRALAAGGPDAVRVESLARVLGVTKGGFYWQFHDRQALLEEMLDAWERLGVDEVSSASTARAETPRRSCGASPGSRPPETTCWGPTR